MGLLVFGLSAQLPFDEAYRTHLEQIAEHIELALARIHAQTVRAIDGRGAQQSPLAGTGSDRADDRTRTRLPACELALLPNGRKDRDRRQEVPRGLSRAGETPLPGVLDRVYQTGEPFVTEELLVPLDRRGDGVVEEAYFRFNLEPLRDETGASTA